MLARYPLHPPPHYSYELFPKHIILVHYVQGFSYLGLAASLHMYCKYGSLDKNDVGQMSGIAAARIMV